MNKILLLDDHAIVLDGLEAILQSDASLEVVAKFSNGNLALSYLKTDTVNLVITDYSMPDMDGLTLVKEIKLQAPAVKIIMLSMHDEASIIRDVMAAGLDGYILKKYAQSELLHAVEAVLAGGNYWSKEVSRALLNIDHEQDCSITERETEVLKLLCEELTSREIAERLFISERTVETHRKNLMRKTNSTNTVGLIKYAFQNHLI